VTDVKATRTSVSVTFSRDMNPAGAERLENYTVESPPGTIRSPKTAAHNAANHATLLSGLSFEPGAPVKVTVKQVTDTGGAKINARHNSATFREIRNWRYLVGFGVPSLLFAGLGVVWFSWKDL